LTEDRKAGHRYHAASAAARAATGQGEDGPTLDDKERSHWHERAREWLRADLALAAKQLEGEPHQPRDEVRQWLRHLKGDPGFASTRDPGALARLPEVERRQWQELWRDVEGLLAGAEGPD
jgi:hypothetical protein